MGYVYRGTETREYEDAMERAQQGYAAQRAAKTRYRKNNGEAVCGTMGGVRRHNLNHQPLCEPCRIIKNSYQAWHRNSKPTGRKNRTHGDLHGTYRGWCWHTRTGTPACFPCRIAKSQYRAAKTPEERAAARMHSHPAVRTRKADDPA